jgi:hypothetical protein
MKLLHKAVDMLQPEYCSRVKAGFVLKGTSLHAWCRDNDVSPSYAHAVLTGATNGPAAQALRQRLLNASLSQAA